MPRLLLPFLLLAAVPAGADWPHYAGGPESTRYSPLKQITAANVGSLAVAWSYDTGDAFKGSEMQCQPVVAHGVLYASSPKLRVFALDAATGAPKWTFDPFEGSKTSRWTPPPASRFPRSASRVVSTCARASRAATRGRSVWA